jgi:hypothetical protein
MSLEVLQRGNWYGEPKTLGDTFRLHKDGCGHSSRPPAGLSHTRSAGSCALKSLARSSGRKCAGRRMKFSAHRSSGRRHRKGTEIDASPRARFNRRRASRPPLADRRDVYAKSPAYLGAPPRKTGEADRVLEFLERERGYGLVSADALGGGGAIAPRPVRQGRQ